MDDAATPLLESVTLDGFLSYGPDPVTVGLEPLNVLIGPNGSGKSNFVEAFAVLRALPKDLPLPIREGGGVQDWLWKGPPARRDARIEAVFPAHGAGRHLPGIRYRLVFGAQGDAFAVLDERVESRDEPFTYFGYENGRPMLSIAGGARRELRREDIDPTQSILAQRRDPDAFPELTELATRLGGIRIYRDWGFGPRAAIRQSCRADVRSDFLSEAFDNLPARLAVLKRDPDTKVELLERLRDLGHGFDDLEVVPEGGRLQLYLTEGRQSLAAHRLSDGTLRYLALLAVLLDPRPSPLVVIEEPELGLHFDMMPKIAALLEHAARSTQLVVTTHSDALVDALADPKSVLVCERGEGRSHPTRLEPEKLKPWLERYSLGTLWTRGDLGGTRW
jgi:predicted ATPase